MRSLLILRPEPGNEQTAMTAREAGLDPHCIPLFVVRAVEWKAPDPLPYTGIMMTSANAARFAGQNLQKYRHLPVFAVGEATADAAREAGFLSVVSGDKDVAKLLAQIATLGKQHILHLCGADHLENEAIGLHIDRRIVYSAKEKQRPIGISAILRKSPVVMLHSPRASAQFALLSPQFKVDRSKISLIAISENTANAAGAGWEEVAVAPVPRDEAMIEIARRMCGA